MVITKKNIISLIIIVLLLVASFSTINNHIGRLGSKEIDANKPPDYFFKVSNAENTSFLKKNVGVHYDDGSWTLDDIDLKPYSKEYVDYDVKNFKEIYDDRIEITPAANQSEGFIPVSTYTKKVDDFDDLRYNPAHNMFYSDQNYKHSYSFLTSHYKYEKSVLKRSDKIDPKKYTSLPSDITERTKDLVKNITKDKKSPFEKAIEIQRYLRENYDVVDQGDEPPNDRDLVDWFLFDEKEGNSSHFNSAFVLMARSVGVPCRIIKGYNIKPTNSVQLIDERYKHVWAEIGLECGWITFDATPQYSLIGGKCKNCMLEGDGGGGKDVSNDLSGTKSGKIFPQGLNLSGDPEFGSLMSLFYVSGNEDTVYLKNVVGTRYNGRYFKLEEETKRPYYEEDVEHQISGYDNRVKDGLTIGPIVKFVPGFIPTSLYTDRVTIDEEDATNLTYYPESDIFNSDSSFTSEYQVNTTHYDFSTYNLMNSEGINDDKYLQVPDEITTRTIDLAYSITEGHDSPYEKAVAIRDYLVANYVYDKNYTMAPSAHEPIDWFLFEEKRGICANFNSAFTILCRIADVPTRIVSGYRVRDTSDKKVVKGSNSHCWMELGLDIGWITMDATPGVAQLNKNGSNFVSTNTSITHISTHRIKKGENFTVAGTVTNSSGINVKGMDIKIYLKENKSSEFYGFECGRGVVKDSKFNVTCQVPGVMDVGDYHLVAHAVPNNIYDGSWSDPPVTVISDTNISLRVPETSYRNNTVYLDGKLTDEDDINLTGKSIGLYLDGEKVNDLTTDGYGNFSYNFKFSEFGNHAIQARYVGNDYYLNSSQTVDISIQRISSSSFEEVVAKGDQTDIEGKLMAGSVPVSHEEIELKFDERESVKSKTDETGSFVFEMEDDVSVGYHTFKIDIPKTGAEIEKEILVKTNTSLTISIDEKSNDKIRLKTTLVDYKERGIGDGEIILNHSTKKRGMIKRTDGSGVSNFILDLPKKMDKRKITITARYEGTEIYYPSSTSKTVYLDDPDPVDEEDSILNKFLNKYRSILFLLIPLAVGLASVGFAWKHGYLSILISKLRKKEDKTALMDEPHHDETVQEQKSKRYGFLDFPQIKDEFPLVWGVGDELQIEIDADGDEIKLLVDGEMKNIDSEGDHHSCSHTFNKEEKHRIKVISDNKEEEYHIRIVDYREEIEREYSDLLDHLREKDVPIDNRITPMELEHKLNQEIGEERSIRSIRKYFEKAKYSYYSIKRKDYEEFMVGKQRMVNRIENSE